jgi:hypothetical protein
MHVLLRVHAALCDVRPPLNDVGRGIGGTLRADFDGKGSKPNASSSAIAGTGWEAVRIRKLVNHARGHLIFGALA